MGYSTGLHTSPLELMQPHLRLLQHNVKGLAQALALILIPVLLQLHIL